MPLATIFHIHEEETMNIAGIEFPEDLYYDRQHDWARVEGDVVVQGMT
jgi:hypothetical protein